VLLVALAQAASAYEGAGLTHEQAVDAGAAPQLTKAPVLLDFVQAAYPPEAADAGEGADVAMTLELDAQGHVASVEITKSGGAAFDEAAKAAVLQFRFSPAELDGKPAAVRIAYVYHFKLVTPAPPEPQAADAPPPPPPVNLKGRVLERGTREAVAGASIWLPKSEQSAEADADGRFELRGVPAGTVHIVVTDPHHLKFETDEEVTANDVTDLTAWMLRKLGGGYETTVVGERNEKDVSHHVLEKEELSTVPGTFGDPLRVLQSLPGMAKPPLLSGALLVRGSNPQDTQVLIDGVPIPLLYHFGSGPSVISPSYIDQIDFFPGAYGARYGRAIAGIVDVTTGGPTPTGIHGQANIDLLNAGFYVETPLGHDARFGTLSLAARHSIVDFVLPFAQGIIAARSRGTSIAVLPSYWDYQARYTLGLGHARLELSAFGSNDQLKISEAGTTTTQPFSLTNEQGFHRFRLKVSEVTDGWTMWIAPTAGVTLNTADFGDNGTLGRNSIDLNVRSLARKQLLPWLTFEAGLDVNAGWYDNSFTTTPAATPDDPMPAPVSRDQRVNLSSYALYSEVVFQPIERLRIIPGLRFEVYRLPHSTVPSFEPRISARFTVNDRVTLKAASGLYREAPLASQLDPNTGNPYLGLAMSEQTAGGVEVRILPKLSLDVQGYFNARSNLVVSSSALVERDGQMVFERLNNSGIGRAYGLEVLLKQDVTERMYGWIAYTLSRSEQLDPATQTWVPVTYDETHILTVVASYKFQFGIEAGLRFQLVTGMPQTPVLGSTFNANTGNYVPIYGAPNSVRAPTFNQLDLRVEKIWTFDWWKFSLYLDVQNVYNASNPALTIYDYRYRQSTPLNGLPIIPSLGVKGVF
jgi:TonB family protein